MTRKLMLVALIMCASVNADPVTHKFSLWGTMEPIEKLGFYHGWTNGFLAARRYRDVELANCLVAMGSDQAIAMIDKRYRDYPEKWSQPIGDQMLRALTVEGGPCEGKNPLR